LVLSERRAQAVVSHLISQGIDSSKIKAVGIGESRPVASNETSEGRANNRRVEIIVQPE
jgi:outer membrane protein OmpA-like peptidoglycan-associated protein